MWEISHLGPGRLLLAVATSWGLLSAAAPAGAKLYQCVDANGKLAFQDRPCAAGERSTEIESVASKSDQAPAPSLAREEKLQLPGQHGGGAGMGFRIDTAEVNSETWVDAMAAAGQAGPLRAGVGQMTLLRVLLEGDESADIQLTATKLVRLDQNGGGGTYQQLSHGDFVLIEHIGSTARKNGRDLLKVGTVAHGQFAIRVPVPAKGSLGVLGDLILSEASVAEKGVLEATVATQGVPGISKDLSMRLGPIAVGGPYGYSIPFGRSDQSDIGGQTPRIVLAPGTYKIAMLDFDTVKSRFTVEVESGERVAIRFDAKSEKVVEMSRTGREPVPASLKP
jgi:hypothetical protein